MQMCCTKRASGKPHKPKDFMSEKVPFNEMLNADGSVREPYQVLSEWLGEQPSK